MLVVMLMMAGMTAAAVVVRVPVFVALVPVMLARMLVPSEVFAMVVMLVFLAFLGELGFPALVEDLPLAFPLLMPIAIAPGVGLAPLAALVPRMSLLPSAEVPSAHRQPLLDARMMHQKSFEIGMLIEIGGAINY